MSQNQTHPYFVPQGSDRQATARLLVGTADEFGIEQRDIATTREGFRISEALKSVLDREGADLDTVDLSDTPRTAATGWVGDATPDTQSPRTATGNVPEPVDEDPNDDLAEEDEGDEFVVADNTVDQVKAFVTENPGTAEDVLAVEREGKNRTSLVKWLEEQVGQEQSSESGSDEATLTGSDTTETSDEPVEDTTENDSEGN